MMKTNECDFNCDDCRKTLCTQGNPTLEKDHESDFENKDDSPWVDECDEITFWSNFYF